MNNLFFLFGYSSLLTMLLPLLLTFFHPLFFVPFLVLTFYRCPFNKCLWWAFACGVIIDLFSSQTPLGISPFNYCLTTFCLYSYKDHFFEDRPSTLPIMTICFASLSNFIQACLLFIIGKPFHFSWEWIQSDLFSIPLQTTLYAVIAFIFPSFIMTQLKRKWRRNKTSFEN